jgi:predicted DNA-binding transcriptional regulator AlpA
MPRGLSREAAAQYCGFGTTKFDEMIKDGRLPKPARVDGRVVWDLHKLDKALDRLYQTEAETETDNPWDAALPP